MREINRIIVHCSDSPDSLDFGVRDIRQWHLDRGCSDIGYHHVVRRTGAVEAGRPEEKIGAHTRMFNGDSIGICWVGRNEIGDKQFESLKKLVIEKCKEHGLDPTEDVYGHYECDIRKTCPNLDMDKFRAELVFV